MFLSKYNFNSYVTTQARNCLRMMSIILSETEWSQTNTSCCSQQDRKIYINNMCRKYNYPGTNKEVRFYIDSNHKIAYGITPKCASSTIKTLMVRIASKGMLGYKNNIHTEPHKQLKLYGIRLDKIPVSSVKKRLSGYTIFTIVRNPFSRLLSAYKNKILQPLMRNLSAVNYTEADKKIPSFKSFLEMLVSEPTHNVHWRSYLDTLSPCQVDYEYILRLETLNTDLKKFLANVYQGYEYKNHSNIHRNPSSQPKSLINVTTTVTHLEEFQQINSSLLDKVIHMYRYDLLLFGYDFTKDTSMAGCNIDNPNYKGGYCC